MQSPMDNSVEWEQTGLVGVKSLFTSLFCFFWISLSCHLPSLETFFLYKSVLLPDRNENKVCLQLQISVSLVVPLKCGILPVSPAIVQS